jgi:hypothetical protein
MEFRNIVLLISSMYCKLSALKKLVSFICKKIIILTSHALNYTKNFFEFNKKIKTIAISHFKPPYKIIFVYKEGIG